MKLLKQEIWRGFFTLIAVSTFSCKSMNRFDTASPGMSGEEILNSYGAPARVQKVMHYEVWSYAEINSKECQFIMEKNELSRPVKCFFSPLHYMHRLTSSTK